MISKSEIRRRRRQSERDKARNREEQQKLLRRQDNYHLGRTHQLPSVSRSRNTGVVGYSTPLFSRTATRTPSEMQRPSNAQVDHRFASMLSSYFLNEAYSDAKIQVEDFTIPVHRLILCSQSEYFAKALGGDFSEGLGKTLTCPPQKEPAYIRMLQYLYMGSYSDEESEILGREDDTELMKDARVYFLADSFFLPGLKEFSLGKFRSRIAALWTSDDLASCIAEIYENTASENDGLRAAIIDTVKSHCKELLARQPFLALVEAGGSFASDLVRILSEHGGTWY